MNLVIPIEAMSALFTTNFFFFLFVHTVIGHIYLGKTVTIIRNQRISGDMIMEETPNILKPFAPNRIIVSITDGKMIRN